MKGRSVTLTPEERAVLTSSSREDLLPRGKEVQALPSYREFDPRHSGGAGEEQEENRESEDERPASSRPPPPLPPPPTLNPNNLVVLDEIQHQFHYRIYHRPPPNPPPNPPQNLPPEPPKIPMTIAKEIKLKELTPSMADLESFDININFGAESAFVSWRIRCGRTGWRL